MDKENMFEITQKASRLSYAEWRMVCCVVEKAFASEQSRMKLDDPEAAVRLLMLEM